ncbi:MAG: leucine-rich repeat protein, partial [Clostridiales bacterium]|nr:leucine-rich repeat protein [Clostridiales bacterium]
MRKIRERFLALFLSLVMICSLVPMPAQAAEEDGTGLSVETETESLEVSGEDSVTSLIASTISDAADSEDEDAAGEGTCQILDLTVDGTMATVEFQTTEASDVVVAIYTEDGVQMQASGTASVGSEDTSVSITLEGDIPDYFLATAYLLRAESHEPLSQEYSTELYTEEMQDLVEQTINDFDQDLVLNLDEDEETNFAVYSEGTTLITESDSANILTDNGDGTYTITEADAEFTSLSVGDIFSYNYSDGTVLIVKVGAISVNGTTVTITKDSEIDLSEVFDYVKIDSNENTSITVDNSNLNSNVTFVDSPTTAALDYDGSASQTYTYNISSEYESSSSGVSVSASANLTATLDITGELHAYIGLSYQYVETTVTATATANGTITGKLSAQEDLGKFSISPVTGVVVSFTPTVKLTAEGEVTLNTTFKSCVGFSWNSSSGFTNKSYSPKVSDCDLDVESTVYVGLILTPRLSIISDDIANATITAEVGVKLKATMGWSATDTSYHHDCNVCVAGEIYLTGSVKASLKVWKWSKSTDLLSETSVKWKDFYYSFTYDDFDWTTCPHLSYLVTVTVTDAYGEALPGAVISGTGLEEDPVADDSGVATFYLVNGTYSLTATSEDLSGSESVTIEDAAQEVTIATDPPTVGSGDSGNITWKLDEAGVLTISGSDAMTNYGSTSMPWYEYRASIKKIIVESGVTTIGTNAFNGCSNVTSVSLAEGITSIGNYAFNNCAALGSLTIPESVTTLGYYMIFGTAITSITIPKNVTSAGSYNINGPLSGATLLKKVIFEEGMTTIPAYMCASASYSSYITTVVFPENLTEIGSCAFYNCDSIVTMDLPDELVTIGNTAFYDCDGLTVVEFPKTVSTIGNSSFCGCDSLASITCNYNSSYVSTATSGLQPYSLAIGNAAFQNCAKLSGVTLSENVTSIAENAFDGCSSLSSLVLPESVTSLGYYMLRGTAITSITIPKNVTSAGSYNINGPLSGATLLKEVIFEEGMTTIPAFMCASASYSSL